MSFVPSHSPSPFKMRVVGVESTINALRTLPRKMRFKHMRIALNAGGGVLRDAAKAKVRHVSGALKASLKVKVKIPEASHNPAHRQKPAYIVVGPGRRSQKFFKPGPGWRNDTKATKTYKRVYKDNIGLGVNSLQAVREGIRFTRLIHHGVKVRFPARYAHLVEKGTKRTRKFPFLERAIRTHGALAQLKIIQKLQQALVSEAASARAFGSRTK